MVHSTLDIGKHWFCFWDRFLCLFIGNYEYISMTSIIIGLVNFKSVLRLLYITPYALTSSGTLWATLEQKCIPYVCTVVCVNVVWREVDMFVIISSVRTNSFRFSQVKAGLLLLLFWCRFVWLSPTTLNKSISLFVDTTVVNNLWTGRYKMLCYDGSVCTSVERALCAQCY